MKRTTRLQLISFVVGFCLLAFELVAARLLAPSIGSSTYVWTSVIGVIIAALALGYWAGGQLADKRRAESDIVWLVGLTAIAVLLVRMLHEPVIDWSIQVVGDARLQAVLAASVLFAPASFLMGAISPYLARLNITAVKSSGSRVANLSALNSIGGITGTFVTGFVLFGYLGSRETLGIVVALLVATSWLLVWRYRLWQRLVVSFILIASAWAPLQQAYGVVDIDTPSAHYQVIDFFSDGRPATGLITGPGGIQSAVYKDGSDKLVFWYTREMARIVMEERPSRILMLGGGAFTLPQYLAERLPNSQIDVVEIDPQLRQISEQHFRYTHPANVNLIFNDARTFVNQSRDTYDMILVDVYGDSSIPFSFITREYAAALVSRLTPEGNVLVNVIAGERGRCKQLFDAVNAAYQTEFSYGHYVNQSDKPEVRTNHILMYSHKQSPPTGMRPLPRTSTQAYTDNFAPAERLHYRCLRAF